MHPFGFAPSQSQRLRPLRGNILTCVGRLVNRPLARRKPEEWHCSFLPEPLDLGEPMPLPRSSIWTCHPVSVVWQQRHVPEPPTSQAGLTFPGLICTYMHAYIHICMYVCIHIYIYIYTYISIYLSIYLSLSLSISHSLSLSIYIYIYIYIYMRTHTHTPRARYLERSQQDRRVRRTLRASAKSTATQGEYYH